MWTIAREDLRLSSREFWSLTHKEYDALLERHKHRERMKNYRAGVMASLYFNSHRTKGTKKMNPLDFFEGEQKQERSEGIRPAEEIFAEMALWVNAVKSGSPKRKA
jgi:hypothetical protein